MPASFLDSWAVHFSDHHGPKDNASESSHSLSVATIHILRSSFPFQNTCRVW